MYSFVNVSCLLCKCWVKEFQLYLRKIEKEKKLKLWVLYFMEKFNFNVFLTIELGFDQIKSNYNFLKLTNNFLQV